MIKVYGASDDLVEIEGDIEEEFGAYDCKGYLMFSNGVLLTIEYGDMGIWRIECLADPNNVVEIEKCPPNDDDDPYSDIANIKDDIKFVLFSTDVQIERVRR